MENKALSSSLEDYLEAIYVLSREAGSAHANKISEYLNVNKSSVSWALGQLSQQGFIDYQPYKPIVLTEQGRLIARQVMQRHEQIKHFLTEVLAVDEQAAEANACRMEHVVDGRILERMKQFVTFLQMCPRGGSEWLDGFRYYCEHGRRRPDCQERLADQMAEASATGNSVGSPADSQQALPKRSKQRDRQIIDRLKEVLNARGVELSKPESAIMEVFMNTERHQSMDQIYQQSKQQNDAVDMAMVERMMSLLCEYKIARQIRFRHQLLYEHYHPESHHDHLYCVKCGSIMEFFDPRLEALQLDNAQRANFRLLLHDLDIFGVCGDCLEREATVRDLCRCLAGEAVKVLHIIADPETTQRISDMGLSPGAVLEVLSDPCSGRNMIVMTEGARIMLDGELAKKIRVVPLLSAERPCMGGGRRQRHRHAADRGRDGLNQIR